MNDKKVIAVIVEGPSDEAALGSILKEYFSNNEVQFLVVHGDITTEDYTSIDNILSKINRLIEKDNNSLKRFTNMHLIFNG